MDNILSLIAMRDLIFLLAGVALGVILGAWYNYFIASPKLQVTGSGGGGSGGGNNTVVTRITISNSPGLVGFYIGETTILGKVLWSRRLVGQHFDRHTARECTAWIYDKEINRAVRPLWWHLRDGTYTTNATIRSGESASLVVFARLRDQPRKFFIYNRRRVDGDEVEIPDDEDRFDRTHEFYIHVRHAFSREPLKIACRVIRNHDGRLYSETDGGSGTF